MKEDLIYLRLSLPCALAISGLVLWATDPVWNSKPISNWTEEDARQILTDSPWSKTVAPTLLRRQTEDERREAGNMGQEHGVGYDGVDNRGRMKAPASISEIVKGTGETRPPATKTARLLIRWESALPVRAAELKARFIEPPTLAGDGYSIAVYGIPGSAFKGDPKTLGDPLKNLAFLKRAGKKDVKPSSVEVFEREDGVVVAYLFPLSAEISKHDERIEFSAQIGRLAFAKTFDLEPMLFHGKLEL